MIYTIDAKGIYTVNIRERNTLVCAESKGCVVTNKRKILDNGRNTMLK